MAMLDTKRLLDQFLGVSQGAGRLPAQQDRGPDLSSGIAGAARNALGGNLGGIGGGAIAGGLAALLLGSKGGRKLAGNALAYGGMAVLGALAYRAYQNYQAGKSPAETASAASAGVPALPPPRGTAFNPSGEAAQQTLAKSLLRAMIAAAQAQIFAQMDQLALTAEEKAFVIDELRAPLDVDAVAGSAKSPEEAAEIYAASLLAIDLDNAAERGYLGMLAARLKLDEKLVAHLHATIEGGAETSPPASSG
jgi:uncharacterized membrane protein YebE (DUF533 family)